MNAALEPVKWLVGKWICKEGVGSFPTMPSFKYCEEVEFVSIGQQPVLQYTAKSQHPEKKSPMHYESGFLRIKPGSTSVAFMVAHNFGILLSYFFLKPVKLLINELQSFCLKFKVDASSTAIHCVDIRPSSFLMKLKYY